MIILGIETSCDETGVALLVNGKIVSDRTTTQLLHEKYGGVVPELASRAHMNLIAQAVNGVFEDAVVDVRDLDVVAATNGPGLVGALLVGVSYAKGLAQSLNIPFIGINHLEGHLWAAEMITRKLPTPFLTLIISGGHTLMVEVNDFGEYKKLGGTHDDAVGELFDKTGRMLGFPFPGGSKIDADAIKFNEMKEAGDVNNNLIRFPRAKVKKDKFGFSFSGIKTAVLYYLRENYSHSSPSIAGKVRENSNKKNNKSKSNETEFSIPVQDRIEISSAIMEAVSDMLINGIKSVWCDRYKALIISGGAASSKYLRSNLIKFAGEKDIPIIIPPPHLCTDNGSMIAWIAYQHYIHGNLSSLDLQVDPSASLFLC